MSFFRTRLSVAAAAWVSVSCASANTYVWREMDFAPLPAAGLAGAPVLILPLVGLEAGPGVEGDGDIGPNAKARVDSVIAVTLTKRVPAVPWMAAGTARARVEADSSLPHLDSLPMHLLPLRALMTVSPELIEPLRSLITITQGRYVMAPVRVTWRPGANGLKRAEFTVLLIDARVGAVAWKSDVAGEDTTPLGALMQAVWMLTATAR